MFKELIDNKLPDNWSVGQIISTE